MSYAKSVIPESVKQKWHEWKASVRQAEHDMTGGDKINDGVEMAGWGVEEATEKHKKDASTYLLSCSGGGFGACHAEMSSPC